MRLRNTIIVFILLLIVGGYAWYSSFQPADTAVKLNNITADDIVKINLKYPDHEIELDRAGGGKWQIVKPIKTDADKTASDNLATAIAGAVVKKTVDETPSGLAPYGLDKPEVVVTVTTKNKGTLPGIEVGKTTPVGFSAYIKTTDKPAVTLTESAFPAGMKKTVADLRDRELMTFNVDDVKKIKIEREGAPEIDLVKNGDQWTIDKPSKYSADSTQVRTVLSGLANAKVDSFIDDEPADVSRYGLLKPRLTVTVATANDSQSLLFGQKQSEQGKDGIYVRRGERAPVYTVHGYVMSDADKSIFDLRDKTVLSLLPSTVARISFSAGGKSFAVAKAQNGRWQVSDGVKGEADSAAIERFMDQVSGLRATSIVADPIADPKPYGIDHPSEEASFFDANNRLIGKISVAKVERRNQEPGAAASAPVQRTDYYVSSSAGTALYAIDDFTFGQLEKTEEQFRASTQASQNVAPTPAK
ncbi:MAG TPA: DUF4340 domain-containing protein [Candidatus Binataceae bacterium]